MISDFRKREQPIIFYNTSPSVVDTFLGVNIEEFVVVNSNEELLSHLRSEFYLTISQCTVWKFQDFSVTEILREINSWRFGSFRPSRSARIRTTITICQDGTVWKSIFCEINTLATALVKTLI